MIQIGLDSIGVTAFGNVLIDSNGQREEIYSVNPITQREFEEIYSNSSIPNFQNLSENYYHYGRTTTKSGNQHGKCYLDYNGGKLVKGNSHKGKTYGEVLLYSL
jgi:hypothetical protein